MYSLTKQDEKNNERAQKKDGMPVRGTPSFLTEYVIYISERMRITSLHHATHTGVAHRHLGLLLLDVADHALGG